MIPAVKTMVAVEGGEVWAEDRASGGDAPSTGEAVVMLHPGWGDSRIWDPVLAALPRYYRVVRYDTRGYGSSPPPTASFTQLGDLTAVLDQRGVSRAVVVGHSGGASSAISLALEHPGRVSALILPAPGVQDYPWPEDDPYWEAFETAFTARDSEALVSLGLRTWAAASADAAATDQIRAAVGTFLLQDDFEQPNPPAFARMSELRVPAVVAVGDHEYPMVADCARVIADRIPGCSLVTVPGADHLLPLRAPQLIADLISRHSS